MMLPTLAQTAFLLSLTAIVAPDGELEPARFQSGGLALPSPMTAGGGEVLLELDVDTSGSVTKVTTLRSTPPFTELLREAVRTWRFSPAREMPQESTEWSAVDSKVLVAGVFRPPTTYDAPARGGSPEDVAKPSEALPFPTSLAAPLYPPRTTSSFGQNVLVEVELGADGRVAGSKVLRSEGGLDDVSRDAAAKWRFRPARREGGPVPTVAYLVFGFREPLTSR